MTLAPVHHDSSLHLPEGLTFEEWADKGRLYQSMVKGAQWWCADWALYGRRNYGQEFAQGIAEQLGLARKTIQNAIWVAERFPRSRRRDSLEFALHADVAGLPEPEQDAWLDRAESEGMTRADLRREMGKARALAEPAHRHRWRCSCGDEVLEGEMG